MRLVMDGSYALKGPYGPAAALGSVWIQRDAITAAAIWIMAAKL